MSPNKIEHSTEASPPEMFHAEMISEFFEEARKRRLYSGDDVFAPELMQAGGDFTNIVLLNERIRDRYKGDTAKYYYDVAETHLYAGAYYTHFWSLDHASIKDRNFAMKYLRSGARAAAEPYMTLSREETRNLCSALYELFARRMEPYMKHPDLDSYIYYGMNAFFAVSVSITAKRMGMNGEQLPLDEDPTLACADSEAEDPALDETPDDNNDASAAAGSDPDPEAWQERLLAVKKASVAFAFGEEAPEEGSAERFRADIFGGFLSDAMRMGYIDERTLYIPALVQPGVDFTYTLMTSKPYYDSNKEDMPHYYYKMARHCLFAGAYYAYLWDKQSTKYLEDGFHLKLLRAGLPATAAPIMPISREETSEYCLKLYLQYADKVGLYASHPDDPMFVFNGMHAFYMIGMMIQLKAMTID